MIKRLAEHRIAFLLLVVLLLIQSFYSDLSNPYKRPIAGDAQGYYAYLPAIFIYYDLDFNFVKPIQEKYYVAATSKSFVKEVQGEKVNKTFPGVAILYFPFFAAAHVISILTDQPADGYAFLYQQFFLIGFWFYFLAGMLFFKKVLCKLNFEKKIVDLSLIVMVLATNIFFYTVYDQSVTHIFNFFLVNYAVYLLLKLQQNLQTQTLVILTAILGLLIIIRPTNILTLGLLFFFVHNLAFYKQLFLFAIRFKNLLFSLTILAVIALIPITLWKLQTGNWLVYSYGDEGFNFSKPEITNFLFSYTKGWFVYTPILLLVLLTGFMILYKQNRKQTLIGIAFFILAIYIFSSWWCWYYGAGMSQRVMIDFYIIPGYLLSLIFQKIKTSASLKFVSIIVITFLIFVNVGQAFQISSGILPFGSPTKKQYWDNFLSFTKKAVIYPQEHWDFITHDSVSLNPADSCILKGNPILKHENWSLEVSGESEYSAVVRMPERTYSKGQKLIMSFDARADNPTELSRIIFQFNNADQRIFYPTAYINSDWQRMQFLIEFDQNQTTYLDIYLWNVATTEQFEIRNLSWELYFSKEYF